MCEGVKVVTLRIMRDHPDNHAFHPLAGLVLMIMITLSSGAQALSLFDAPRVFPLTYCGDFCEAADITGDGILDLVTGSRSKVRTPARRSP